MSDKSVTLTSIIMVILCAIKNVGLTVMLKKDLEKVKRIPSVFHKN